MTQSLECKNITLRYDKNTVIHDLSLNIPQGKMTILLGSNGCGKSTLLRGLAGLLKPSQGTVLLNSQNVHKKPKRALAKTLSILPQSPETNAEMIVEDLVTMGRHPHRSLFNVKSQENREFVHNALESTDLLPLAKRRVSSLSGGQRQRVWIAMTLAQNTPWVLLDEPTTFLDLNHQVSILNLLKKLNQTQNKSLVMVLHDINLACRYADHIILLKQGKVTDSGSPEHVITPDNLKHTFDLDCTIIQDPITHTPLCIPHS